MATVSHAGVLVTYPLSHYCEKARWALDHANLNYRERGYPPGVLPFGVRPFGARPRDARSVPVLVAAQTLYESTEIVRFADRACAAERGLYPSDADLRRDVDDVVARLDERLGPSVRAWFYAWALADPSRLYPFAACGLGAGKRALVRVALPKITARIGHGLRIDETTAREAGAVIDAELEWVATMLADGRRYLHGDRFGAADLTFAALAALALGPRGYGGGRLTFPATPDELVPQVRAWRATPAGEHALRAYREHR